MKRKVFIGIFTVAVLALSSCIIDYDGGGNSSSWTNSFDTKLLGTWESNDTEGIYSGTLVIEYRSIKITGYGESQTPPLIGDDNKRPFKGFTRGTVLTGYSEDGKMIIEDRGELQPGIAYTYYTSGSFPKDEFLLFNFGGRDEILKKNK